ncbi:metallophosphoesterase [Desemzia sp. FAM 23991]|uniref:metallophosphoesterase n=1 Tax=unclassified Desemzia TaxID=2685243 RepID=UPI00388627F7
MKKKTIAGIILFLTGVLVFVFGMGQSIESTELKRDPLMPTEAISKTDSIWIITDVHYLSPSLFDNGENFDYIQQTSAGKELDYPTERMEALVWQIEKERPKLLIVSGDLTLNGEKQSALDLADYFHQIEELGTQVYVIPGNHDISNGWARKFNGDSQEKTTQILPQDFQTIFSDMGYTEAFSVDEHSLSYAVQPYTDLILLMLDTNVYSQTEGKGAPPSNGLLKKETLVWMESVLKEAKETEATVLPVLHHNLLEHNDFMTNGFTLDNAQVVQELFAKYETNVAFSGHTHVQDIANKEDSLYDITTAAFSIMTPSIGQITIDSKQLNYQKSTLDVDSWAAETNQTDEQLLHYADYATSLFVKDGIDMGLRQIIEEQWYDKTNPDEVGTFVGENNRLFFSGESSQISSAEAELMKQTSAYQAIKEYSRGFLLRYTDNILKLNGQSDLTLTLPLFKD